MLRDAPLVSVVIPHRDDLDNLRRCLAALGAQTWPRLEVVVADNNSAAGAAAVAAAAPHALVVPAPELGAGPARNQGAAAARGDILAFLDSDCIAEPGWIEAGLAALGRYDYAGGSVLVATETTGRLTAAEAYEAVFAFNVRKYVERDGFAVTANLFVPRAVFARVGGFRNGVSEDMDWCRRATALGYHLGYAAEAVVRHPARRDWRALTRKWDRVVSERFRLESERPGWRWRWIRYLVLVALSPLPHAFRVLSSPRLPALRLKALGLAGLFGIRFYRAWRMGRYAASAFPGAAGRS